MMSRPPAISVLMTVFNAGKFLDASIRSVAAQTFVDWEFVIVDDASTDGSADVAEGWASRDRRIRLIRNEKNKGQTSCLNQGLREASGTWVARQDADDLSHPLRLTRQFERVTVQPELDLLGTCGRMIDAHDRLQGLLDVPLTVESIRWSAALLNPFLHTAVMFRRRVVMEEFGGYDEGFRISQDYELWTRMAARRQVANLQERLICYRSLASSLSNVGSTTAFSEAARISEREERTSFGRLLSADERLWVSEFREGRGLDDRGAFLNLYRELIAPLKSSDKSRLMAAHRLKLAGASGPAARMMDLIAAFRWDPSFVAGWLKERWQG